MEDDLLQKVKLIVKESNGILNLAPTWVARDFMPAGHRLGLRDYSLADKRRGEICERWIGSTTHADNEYGPEDEGLSYIACPDGSRLLLRDAINSASGIILGEEYSRTHRGLNVFTDFFDYAAALPFHLHTQLGGNVAQKTKRLKDEAYYFPEDVPMGVFPYSFLGLHPSLAKPENRRKLLPYLEQWEGEEMLKLSKAYKLVPGEGFLVPVGTLHAPGTALTLEMQESSDVFNMFTPPMGDGRKSKDLLWRDVDPNIRSKMDFNALLELVNWDVSCDPYFYEHYHLSPIPTGTQSGQGGDEYWIFYGTAKFSGKKTVIRPRSRLQFQERGPFTLLVWRGVGKLNDIPIKAGEDHSKDEFFFVHEAARRQTIVENVGDEDLIMFKFFAEDINFDAPGLPEYP